MDVDALERIAEVVERRARPSGAAFAPRGVGTRDLRVIDRVATEGVVPRLGYPRARILAPLVVRLLKELVTRDGEQEREKHDESDDADEQGNSLDEADDDRPQGLEPGDGSERPQRPESPERPQPAVVAVAAVRPALWRGDEQTGVPSQHEREVEPVPRVSEVLPRAPVRYPQHQLQGEEAVETQLQSV